MDLITETYLGWTPYPHKPGCPSPEWDDIQYRHTQAIRPDSYHPDHPHTCTNATCGHNNTYPRTELRLLCRTCHTVHLIAGEALTQDTTDTAATGWGQPPTALAGLWLWPGRPTLDGGQPYEYLVTRQPQALTPDLLHGIITAYRDATGTRRWLAAAHPHPDGAHQVATLRWHHSSNALDDLAAAAGWIAGIDTRAQRPVVVSV
ncbi:hypothetical protein [Streptomyces antibioticus]|uniref:hypothetical protein n=1 Tax=Streptomyces antibioticus TaxID=1890 RepID=UPI0033BCFA6C